MTKEKKKTNERRRPSVAERALVSIREAGAFKRGEIVPGLIVHHPVDAKKVREETGLTQAEFAQKYGFSLGSLRDWEQRRKAPERMAQMVLAMIQTHPEFVEEVARNMSVTAHDAA